MSRVTIPFLLAGALAAPTRDAAAADNEMSAAVAIRQASKSYVEAVNRGDRERVAAFWTPDGDLIDASGRSAKGRELARQISSAPGLRENRAVTLKVDSLRLITPEVAIEDGVTEWPDGTSTETASVRFTAVWVKRNGEWLLDSVRESSGPSAASQNALEALHWLVGEWVSSGEGPRVEMSCKWSVDKHFLLRELQLKPPEGPPLSISQRIGWDTASGQIKSWTFDSQGGHGTGIWMRNADGWTVTAEGVLADGQRASSRNSYRSAGPDVFGWESSSMHGDSNATLKVQMIRKTAN
jgi:uncharacterized protein (TIGR02246 family)